MLQVALADPWVLGGVNYNAKSRVNDPTIDALLICATSAEGVSHLVGDSVE